MAKLPSFVQASLTADRTQQLNTLTSLIAYVFGEEKADRTVDKLGETLHKQAPHRSVKTWQNYVSAVNAVVQHQGPKLESLFAEHQSAADMVAPLQSWLSSELTKKRYHSSPDDVINWAKGALSLTAKAKLAKKNEADALKEQARIDAEAAKVPAPTPAPVTAAESEALAQIQTAPLADTLATFTRTDGAIHLELAPGLTRADLITMALAIEMRIDALAPVEELAEA